MTDRSTTLMLERLRAIAARKPFFSYDVRGDSYVNTDLVVAYAIPGNMEKGPELEKVVQHALEHDSIVSGKRDAEGRVHYTSCRLFTDMNNAMRFAREHGQATVYNWNRHAEVPVEPLVVQDQPTV
ncbi:MAG: hypothetical protein R2815_14345 [Flavobacteriales bacterium]